MGLERQAGAFAQNSEVVLIWESNQAKLQVGQFRYKNKRTVVVRSALKSNCPQPLKCLGTLTILQAIIQDGFLRVLYRGLYLCPSENTETVTCIFLSSECFLTFPVS